ncbi:MAG: RNA polymerase factor sigma-54, partial [Pseudomonadota bacterium]
LATLRALDPAPGRALAAGTEAPVTPDLVLSAGPAGPILTLNEARLPRASYDAAYARRLGRSDDAARDWLAERRRSAGAFLRAVARRKATLLAVGEVILARQPDWLAAGDAALRPLTRREIAGALGLHPSTVTRATQARYIATPRGTRALSDFFSASPDARHSATAIGTEIRKLIAREDPAHPLSDSKIARILADTGITVARRTIAKYREGMTIPSSAQRRRAARL